MATTLELASRPVTRPDRLRSFLVLAGLFTLLTALYETTRYLVGVDSAVVPLRHARDVIGLERALGLFVEPHLRSFAKSVPPVEAVTVWIYTYEHLAGSIIFLAWLWLMRPKAFPFVWRWFWLAHVVAVIGFWLYPLGPPRLVPELAMGDPTAAELSNAPGWDLFAHVRNDYAAMPSLHCGYPLIFATVLWFVLPKHPARWLVWLWPAAVTFSVMATANHYWLDAVGGLIAVGAALGVALVLFKHLPRPWQPEALLTD